MGLNLLCSLTIRHPSSKLKASQTGTKKRLHRKKSITYTTHAYRYHYLGSLDIIKHYRGTTGIFAASVACPQSLDKKRRKTYNSEDSLVVTHPTTNSPACGLSTAERTGSPVFHTLWSYVLPLASKGYIRY
ncbi:hypothetical protein PDIG_46440 [Penicillium digitatum PHI26]|uniref:Uncharacterized protein n=2 Tax=Penicillium digitatum TaxID=36651 RepID=K9FT81_PEND2|nr:hypothetical protein PDIP_18360 [Penicillium digitatum Pd1]EKV12319.1 hypothetical protein PDIG_46440 [Penicillium digitatum PHI26]EKV20257.1 hypothetical protein PDIP_18360 [Penicillium digitatum Pd1]